MNYSIKKLHHWSSWRKTKSVPNNMKEREINQQNRGSAALSFTKRDKYNTNHESIFENESSQALNPNLLSKCHGCSSTVLIPVTTRTEQDGDAGCEARTRQRSLIWSRCYRVVVLSPTQRWMRAPT